VRSLYKNKISYENTHDACGHRHTEWKLNKPPGHGVIMWAGKAVAILDPFMKTSQAIGSSKQTYVVPRAV
jgi:hypothetical protein